MADLSDAVNIEDLRADGATAPAARDLRLLRRRRRGRGHAAREPRRLRARAPAAQGAGERGRRSTRAPRSSGRSRTLPLAIAPTGGISAGRAGAPSCRSRARPRPSACRSRWPRRPRSPSSASPRKSAGGSGSSSTPCASIDSATSWWRAAKTAGYEAMLVTVDLPVSGKRERDPRNGFLTPYNPNWRNSRDVIFKPAWLLEIAAPRPAGHGELRGLHFSTPSGTDIATAVGREMDAGARLGTRSSACASCGRASCC